MTCFHPIEAWQQPDGTLRFKGHGCQGWPLQLPCGKCIGCRKVRVRDWAIRCMHEARMHPGNSFITLTYDEEHATPGLNYEDLRLFIKRLRRAKGAIRYFAAGEYGKQTKRPHFHALLFNTTFQINQKIGNQIYRSKELEQLWNKGYSSIGELNYTTAGYVAKYAIKNVQRDYEERMDLTTGEIHQRPREAGRMSLKPGIGEPFLKKYWREIYLARDAIVLPGGRTVPAPRFYDNWLKANHPELYDTRKEERALKAQTLKADTTPERLHAREICAIASQQRNEERTKL